jgi:Domain of unknown function (DUF202)
MHGQPPHRDDPEPPGATTAATAEAWDEGLAPQRTELAWGRTGLAVAVAVAVLARRAATTGGAVELAALALVGAGALAWLIGMRLSRGLHLHLEPHGLVGARAFALISGGTVVMAVGALALGFLLHR